MRPPALAAALLVLGCAGPRANPPAAPARLLEVPIYSDASNQCGPAALASLLTFWGRPTAPEDLRADLFIPVLDGTLPLDMAPAARARGFDAASFSGDAAVLRAAIDRGQPLVVFWNIGLKSLPMGHYVVVTGYNDQGFYVHSGGKKNRFVPHAEFDKYWEKTHRWTLRVAPLSP